MKVYKVGDYVDVKARRDNDCSHPLMHVKVSSCEIGQRSGAKGNAVQVLSWKDWESF